MAASDAELLQRWRNGDQLSGQRLVERNYALIERFFLNKVSSDIEDLVQETFLGCVKNRDRVTERGKFRSYLFSIAYNVLRMHLRKRYRSGGQVEFEEEAFADLEPRPSLLIAKRQEQRHLIEGLRSIPIAYQVLLELFYWEKLTSEEMASILQIPSGTVRGRLRRARELLAKAMNRLANSAEPLESTLTKLDDWAEACRRQLLDMVDEPGA